MNHIGKLLSLQIKKIDQVHEKENNFNTQDYQYVHALNNNQDKMNNNIISLKFPKRT